MKKYYAVQKGRQTGVYQSWAAAKKQVEHFKGAVFKSFPDLASAQAFLQQKLAPVQEVNLATYAAVIYTDGGSRNHGNHRGGHVLDHDPAAWAYLIKAGPKRYQGTNGQWGATNNQMELTAVIQGLLQAQTLGLSEQKLLLVADSRYVLDALTRGWLQSWQQKQWRKADGKVVANQELWRKLAQQIAVFSDLHYAWTKGHAQDAENNFVDGLLNQTMDQMTAKSRS
ncbi:viroplasmin family protein [Lactobacillus sp. DCY120]|uniref:Ribonuclease H n=1 Tax=Bombilactobacillus apium TaxID=2675299 RepID=A0A850QXD3_9LACO|nr:ribonuclease H family protein [Bombilactobacillus apium]NVY96464.1 viroplasmin family protein [Bombilactobacillus apium]